MFTNRLFKAIVVVALIVIASVVTLSLTPAPKSESAVIPVTGNQSAYSEYLSGEKAYIASVLNTNDTFSAWSYGEKVITRYDPVEVALLLYRFGEKNIK
jgi:hypothetical protein